MPLSLGADKKVRNKDAKSAAEVATDRFCRMALMQMPEAADVAIDNLSTLNLDEERGSSTSRRNKDDERNEENDDVEEEQTKKVSKRKKERERLKNMATHSIQALLNCGNDVNEITSIQANTALYRAAARTG